jgi:hypothetical protein
MSKCQTSSSGGRRRRSSLCSFLVLLEVAVSVFFFAKVSLFLGEEALVPASRKIKVCTDGKKEFSSLTKHTQERMMLTFCPFGYILPQGVRSGDMQKVHLTPSTRWVVVSHVSSVIQTFFFVKEISHADVGFRLGKKLPIVGQNIHLSKRLLVKIQLIIFK